MIGPAINEVHLDAGRFGKGGAAIQSDAGAGILRGETDHHSRGDSIFAHLAHYIGDVGLPVTHAHIHGQAECLGKQAPLLLRELGQGTRSNKTVTVTNLFDDRFRHGTSAGYVA